jgi:hypothetical protein
MEDDFFSVAYYGLTDFNEAFSRKPIGYQIETIEDFNSLIDNE